jgi:hypothetical protein
MVFILSFCLNIKNVAKNVKIMNDVSIVPANAAVTRKTYPVDNKTFPIKLTNTASIIHFPPFVNVSLNLLINRFGPAYNKNRNKYIVSLITVIQKAPATAPTAGFNVELCA